MGKDNQKNLVGQPILKQIINLIPSDKFNELIISCKSDRYYKTFFRGSSWSRCFWVSFPVVILWEKPAMVCTLWHGRFTHQKHRKESVKFEEFYTFDSTTML